MLQAVAGYSEHVSKGTYNPDLFTRAFDKPLVECLVDTAKGLNVVPGLEFVRYEFITDMTKIDIRLNKRIIKDKAIRNNDAIHRTYNINETYCGQLVFYFNKKKDNGVVVEEKRTLLVPMPYKGLYYLINGKLALPTLQVVNNSTYIVKGALKFKTSLFPLSEKLANMNLVCENNKEMFKANCFSIDLFGKEEYNPLLFFIADMGFEKMIRYFDLEGTVMITEELRDPEQYIYFKASKNFYLEVHKQLFLDNELKFFRNFIATLLDLIKFNKSMTLGEVFDKKYWIASLGGIFGKQPSLKKGMRSLLSFSKMLDMNTKKSLKLERVNKQDSFALMRWIMTDFHNLLRKDNLDADDSRIRVNEYLSFYFDQLLTNNIYSIFNGEKITEANLTKLLNSINNWALIRAMRKGSASGSLLRFERFNDFDAISYVAYSEKGPSGQMGGKHKTRLDSRNVNPTQIGKFDFNVCSANDPGLTGAICANIKLYNGTHFSDRPEPQTYFKELRELKDNYVIDTDYARAQFKKLSTKGRTYDPKLGLHVLHRRGDNMRQFIEERQNAPLVKDGYLYHDGIKVLDDGTIQFVKPIKVNEEGLIELNFDKRRKLGIYELDFESRIRQEKVNK